MHSVVSNHFNRPPFFHLSSAVDEQITGLHQPPPVYNRRNVESRRDYDPLRQREEYSHHESRQWARPVGSNHFQQFSQVSDESTTDAPNVHRRQRAKFEYLTSDSPDSRTKAVHSQQSFQETRREGSSVRTSSVKVQSFSSRTVTSTTDSQRHFNQQGPSCRIGRPTTRPPTQHKIDDLELCNLDLAEPLDHSLQIDKKNLSKSGSLSRRRRPSRSNRTRINMEQLFTTNNTDSNDDEDMEMNSSSSSISNSSSSSVNGHGLSTGEINKINSSISNGHSKQMKKSDDKVRSSTFKQPDLIRDVHLSKETSSAITNKTKSYSQQQQQQHTNRIRFEKEEDEAANGEENNNCWLQQAKLRLRKSFPSLIDATNNNNKLVSSNETTCESRKTFVETEHINGNNVTSSGKTQRNGFITTESRNGNSVKTVSAKCNNNNSNNNQVKSVLKPRVSFENAVVNNRRHSMDMLDTDEEMENEEGEDKKTSQSNIQSLEKNKSKSTSNLDDDETIEAPWFKDLKYQKDSLRNEANKKLARSSINLRWTSTNGEPLVVPIPHNNNVRSNSTPATTTTKVKIIPLNINKSLSTNGKNQQTVRHNQTTTKIDCTSSNQDLRWIRRKGPGPPLITTGVIPQRLSNIRSNADNGDCWNNRSRRCESSIKDKPTVGRDKRIVVKKEEESCLLSSDRYGGSHCANSIAAGIVYDDPDARLPREELMRRSLIDWDNLERAKKPAAQSSSRLQEVKLRKTIPDLTEAADSMAATTAAEGAYETRGVSSPGLSATLLLDSESTDDDAVCSSGGNRWWGALADGRGTDDDRRRSSFYESETWRKLEETLQQVNLIKNGSNGYPEWVKEAEKKKNSWISLNNLDVESGSSRVNSEAKPQWLDEVKRRHCSASSPPSGAAESGAVNNNASDVPAKRIQIIEKAKSEQQVSRANWPSPNVGGGTGWAYVQVRNGNASSPNFDSSSAEDESNSEVHSVSFKSSDCSQSEHDFRRQISVEHSNFDVEQYVRELISRRRSQGLQRGSLVETPTPPACSPDWLQHSLHNHRKLIDWNSLEKLNSGSATDVSENVLVDSIVSLRKVPKVRKIMSEETRIIAALKPVANLRQGPKGSTSSDQSDEWADAVEQHEVKPLETDDDAHKDDEDVFSEKCLKVKGEAAACKQQLEGDGSASRVRSEVTAPWVTEIQLRSRSRSPVPVPLSSAVNMPCIRSESKQQANGESQRNDDDVDDDVHTFNRKSKTGVKLDYPSSKKVTFSIPQEDNPEWIKLAEAKCKKTIKWEDLEKHHEASPKETHSSTTWISQVQLKHVPLAEETVDVCIPPPEQPHKSTIRINLRHVMPHEPEVKVDSCSPLSLARATLHKANENGSEQEMAANGSKDELATDACDDGLHKEEPDWMKVARQKKQAHVDWEQLGSAKKSGLMERPLPVIKEDNQVVMETSVTSGVLNQPAQTNGGGKLRNGVESKSPCGGESPYRTWVVNKTRNSNGLSTPNAPCKWQSDPQLNTTPPSTKPCWFQLAEKKRNSVTNWSSIERGPSPVLKVSTGNWMQEVRLRTPSPTPSPQAEPEDDSKCTSPFPVHLRHVEEKMKPLLLNLDEKNSPWMARSSSTEIDKWQIRYRDLFEDLSDEASPTEENDANGSECGGFFEQQQQQQQSLAFNAYQHQTRSNSSSPRRFRSPTATYESNRQRRRLESHHRYFSLPEMSALPRNASELEIVHLNGSESPLSADDRPPTIPESPTLDDNEVHEEKLVPFIRLRSTEKKETNGASEGRNGSSSRESEPFWMKEIKLRKVPLKETEELESKLSRCLSDQLQVEHTSPSSNSTHFASRIPRTCSAPAHISTGLTIREAIHRDLKIEVARREQRKSSIASRSSDKDVDSCSDVSSILSSSSHDESSTKVFNPVEPLIILATDYSLEKVGETSPMKKPLWMEELQQRKTQSKRENGVKRNNASKLPETPSFQNVLEEIKTKGRDRLFSSLRRSRQDDDDDNKTETDKQSMDSSSVSSEISTVSTLSDEESTLTPGAAFTTKINDHDEDDDDEDYDFVDGGQCRKFDAVKNKRFRPVSVPITVDHILQQNSHQFIDGNKFSPICNGSPVKENSKSKSVDENQQVLSSSNNHPITSSSTELDNNSKVVDSEVVATAKSSLEELKSPLLLLGLLSRFSKSCSETNLTGLGAPSAKSRFEAATSRMTSSCSNLESSAGNKNNFHQYDELSWSSGGAGAAFPNSRSNPTVSNHELMPTLASSSSASDLEMYEEAESENYENCKSEFSVQLRTTISNSDRHDSEISLD